MFWHDITQAQQRLGGSVVLWGDAPVRFGRIENRTRVEVRLIVDGSPVLVSLEDPKFHDFRRLPALGFVNTPGHLCWMARIPSRASIHGLCRNNTQVYDFQAGQLYRSEINYDSVVQQYGKFYVESVSGKFPDWRVARSHLSINQPIAIDHQYALVRGNDGTDQVWRNRRHIGSVNNSGFSFTKANMFYREELRERLNINEIMEV